MLPLVVCVSGGPHHATNFKRRPSLRGFQITSLKDDAVSESEVSAPELRDSLGRYAPGVAGNLKSQPAERSLR